MLIYTSQEILRVGAAVKFGEMMGEGTILQVRLIAANKDPVIRMPKQRAAFRGIERTLLGIRRLCKVWRRSLLYHAVFRYE